jgi:hypothetical protein
MAFWNSKTQETSNTQQEILEKSKTGDIVKYPRRDMIPQIIALALLFTFITTVIGLFFTNIYSYKFLDKTVDSDFKKGWFDLLKNSLVLLSTALTTVIGYYFGQREGTIKNEQAVQQLKSNEQEAVQLAASIYQNRNKAAKEGVIGNDAPDLSNPPATLDDDIIVP